MRKINMHQLETLLRNLPPGATAVSLVARTDPRMRKTDNPHFGRIVKLSHVNGMIGFKYSNSVNNQRVREDHPENFEALPRTWGERIRGTPLIEHKGQLYLEIKVQRSIRTEFRHTETGETVSKETLKPWLPKRRESGRQQVTREVILRDYKLSGIIQLRMHGENYELEPLPAAPAKAA